MDFERELENLEKVSPVMRNALRNHPDWIAWLKRSIQSQDAPSLVAKWSLWLEESTHGRNPLGALHPFKLRETIEIALRDIAGMSPFEETVARLSLLADWVIETALRLTWSELAVKNPAVPEGKPDEGFAVFALGKLGGRELNYSSDVDLIFCRRASEDDRERRFFSRLGELLVQALGRSGPEGFLYRVDMRLRPHGETGPLVPTIESLENYYESWGEAWERQALIKVRAICGDEELCRRFMRFAGRFTFARQMDDSSLEEIKRVKHRSEKEYARTGGRIHIKQGAGGIRDIEFYVQYLQLIAGNQHPEVREAGTLKAIRALGGVKALLAGEESQLSLAYLFLRTLEHRLQLRALIAEELMPECRSEMEALALQLGLEPENRAAADLLDRTLRGYQIRVRSILERIYLPPGTLRPREREEEFAQLLSERTPKDRVRNLLLLYGFRDTDKAWQNLRLMALGPAGHLLPPGERRAFLEIVFPLLEVLRESYDPDQALHHLESFAAASGNRVSFLRALASRRAHLSRLSNLLALSNLSHQILIRHPEYFDSLARGIHLQEGRKWADMFGELANRLQSTQGPGRAIALRRYRQREMIRIAYRDLAGLGGTLDISGELSDLAEACLRASMELACESDEFPLQIVALGKFGSRQMHYSSDLDLLFLYEDPPACATQAERTRLQLRQDHRVERLLELLAGVTSEGIAYKIDLRLRPEGGSGLLARSWTSFVDHTRKYMQPWERMALVRSRMLICAAPFRARWDEFLLKSVYEFGWDTAALEAVRYVKRRIEAEHNRESRINLDFKFGHGGITDLEFLIQLMQVRLGSKIPGVRAPGIQKALCAIRDAGAISEEECASLQSAHSLQRRVENHYQLIEEWTSREISRESPVLDRLARSLGYRDRGPESAKKAFLSDWNAAAHNVRSLVDKYFYAGSTIPDSMPSP